MSKYILVKECDEEIYVKELYTIVANVEPGCWYDDHKIAESDNPFDFIQSDGNWAVESRKNNFMLKVRHKGTIISNSLISSPESIYFFTDYSNSLGEDEVDFIYHKDQKGNWLLAWRR